MALKILNSYRQIHESRNILEQRGISCLTSKFFMFLARLGIYRKPVIGDYLKSWDILQTVEFIENHLEQRDCSVMDIGAYSSEMTLLLYKMGFKNVYAVDLNPRLKLMPFQAEITYRQCDFMNTALPDSSLTIITAISVIEHGFQLDRLLSEVLRLLKEGGYFIASFDYWPEKIDTKDQKCFDMDWKIFSRNEVEAFISEAAKYGFEPTGALDLTQPERVVEYFSRRYTFCWLALRKKAGR